MRAAYIRGVLVGDHFALFAERDRSSRDAPAILTASSFAKACTDLGLDSRSSQTVFGLITEAFDIRPM